MAGNLLLNGGEQLDRPAIRSVAPNQVQRVDLKRVYRPCLSLEVFYTGGDVAVLPDGKHVACPCGDAVKVVEISTGKVAATLEGDGEPLTTIAASPDGVSLFASSRSLQTRWWHWPSSMCKRSWKVSMLASFKTENFANYVSKRFCVRAILHQFDRFLTDDQYALKFPLFLLPGALHPGHLPVRARFCRPHRHRLVRPQRARVGLRSRRCHSLVHWPGCRGDVRSVPPAGRHAAGMDPSGCAAATHP